MAFTNLQVDLATLPASEEVALERIEESHAKLRTAINATWSFALALVVTAVAFILDLAPLGAWPDQLADL